MGGSVAGWSQDQPASDAAPANTIFDRVLVSVGRRPNTDGLGLEHTSAKLNEQGFIEVDNQMRSADKRIFAIGDAVGNLLLAHKAIREGKIAATIHPHPTLSETYQDTADMFGVGAVH